MFILWFIIYFILIVSVIYLILIMPQLTGKKRFSFFSQTLYAHRGLHSEKIPENSMSAFREAVERGYGIELDVQLTKDDCIVVFHDDDLKRMCGVEKYVRELTFDELNSLRLMESNEKIPLFADVLNMLSEFENPPHLIVEIKNPVSDKIEALCDRTVSILKQFYPDEKYCIESFSPLVVAYIKKRYPEIIRGQLSDAFMRDKKYRGNPMYFLLQHMLLNILAKPHFIAYNFRNSDSLTFRLIKFIYKPITAAWTVRSEAELIKAKESGFNVYIFENIIPKQK